MPTRVTIILPNAVEVVGLRHIIEDVSTASVSCYTMLDATTTRFIAKSDWYVTDETTFVSNLSFFLPNKDKAIVLTHQSSQVESSPHLLCVNDPEEIIISNVRRLLDTNSDYKAQSKLTQRETSVLKLVASGLTNKMIADKLNISINTVLSHRKNITAKLGIKSVSGLSVYAIMNGIVSLPDA